MQVTRRRFLTTAAAAVAAPAFVGATDKAGRKAPILGQGEHRYAAIHDWGELPRTLKYGNTHGVCEDSQGHIYVLHTVLANSDSLDTMVVFDPKGRFVRSWGRQFKGGAHGLTLGREGSEEFLYLCDFQHGIVTKRTLKGEEVFTRGEPAEVEAYRPKDQAFSVAYRPTHVANAPNGDLYVGDGYGSSFINQYKSEGRVHPDIWWFGQSGRPARLPTRSLCRSTRRDALTCGHRPRQQPSAAIYARWQTCRQHTGYFEDCLVMCRDETGVS